jgi:thiol-disulfide isomerase/thioredoxin
LSGRDGDSRKANSVGGQRQQPGDSRPEVGAGASAPPKARVGAMGAAAAVLFFAVAILWRVGGPGQRGDVSVGGRATPGAASPEVHLVDFDGEPLALTDYRGKPVVLNFWASWCPSCVAEMPEFEKVHQRLKAEVVFLGIDQRDDRSAAEELAGRTGVTYRLAEDPDGRVYDAFGGVGMPTTVFIGANGEVVDVVTGQLTEELLRHHIARSFGVNVRA